MRPLPRSAVTTAGPRSNVGVRRSAALLRRLSPPRPVPPGRCRPPGAALLSRKPPSWRHCAAVQRKNELETSGELASSSGPARPVSPREQTRPREPAGGPLSRHRHLSVDRPLGLPPLRAPLEARLRWAHQHQRSRLSDHATPHHRSPWDPRAGGCHPLPRVLRRGPSSPLLPRLEQGRGAWRGTVRPQKAAHHVRGTSLYLTRRLDDRVQPTGGSTPIVPIPVSSTGTALRSFSLSSQSFILLTLLLFYPFRAMALLRTFTKCASLSVFYNLCGQSAFAFASPFKRAFAHL